MEQESNPQDQGKRIFGVGFIYVMEHSNIIQKTKKLIPAHDVTVIRLDEYPNLHKLRVALIDGVNASIKDRFKQKIISLTILSIWEFNNEDDLQNFIAEPTNGSKTSQPASSILMDGN